MNQKLKKILFITLGSLTLFIGSLGIIVPLLPTTPFLLLTAYFYLKSSKKLYVWLIHHKIFGLYIYSYITYKAIDIKTKVGALILLWSSLAFSAYIMARMPITLMLFTVGLGVTTHLLMLKTLNKETRMQAIHSISLLKNP